jgi:cardiolipin synthase
VFKIKNIANILTLMRIGLIPILIGLFYIEAPFSFITASILFLIACLTDYFDGVVARATKQESDIGRFLDPLADKLIIAAALIMLAGFDRITGLTLIPAVIILCREILVSGLREHLSTLNISLPVTRLSKWKTTIQMFGIGFLIVGDALPIFPFETIGLYCFWLAGALTLITGYDYLRKSLKHM